MFLHIRLRIHHWSNLSEFSFCVRLSALNHSAKILGLRKNAIKSKKPGLSFASGPAGIETCSFVFRVTCPSRKPMRQNNATNATHCRVSFFRNELTTQRRKVFFVLTDNSATLVFHTLARCKLRTAVELFEPFFNVLLSFSLESASRVQHDNESWHARQRAYLTNTFTRTTVELVRGLFCSHKNTVP